MADDAEAAGFVIVRTEAAEFISLEHRVQVKLPYWLCTHCHCQPFTAEHVCNCACGQALSCPASCTRSECWAERGGLPTC